MSVCYDAVKSRGQAMQDAQGAAPFGDLVRRYRRALGITQEELSERSGVSLHAISDIERGAWIEAVRAALTP